MAKPRLIILIRHAQSEGNKNREIHQTTPDHRVKLTSEGQRQAVEAGKKLRSLLRPDDTLHFYTSPYRRTRETTEGILSSLTSDSPTPSPFPRHTIKVYEEPRLREQDFGNFQPCSAEMTRMWQERADYGHFFYRIPNGESAADAYDRISGFNESLWRSFGEEDFASVCVLVTHGLMTRVFLMKWYHWSVEYFEDLRNINHCEFIVMQKGKESGKYLLKNQLRTWTQYQAEKEKDKVAEREAKQASPVPVRKRWGGCPDGCEHGREYLRPRRQNTADLFRDDGAESMAVLEAAMQRKKGPRVGPAEGLVVRRDGLEDNKALKAKAKRALSPNRLAVLRAGRDGGGSRSGNVSRSGSSDEGDDSDNTANLDSEREDAVNVRPEFSPLSPDTPMLHGPGKGKAEELTDAEKEERARQFRPPRSMAMALSGTLDEGEAARGHAMADALGDQSDIEEEEDLRDEEARRVKENEGSFEESVR